MSEDHFTLYAWGLSWYSAKVRAYLKQKGIPFIEKKPSAYTFFYTIKKRCHDGVVPVVITPENDWLQDSTLILEELEKRFARPSIYPATPVQAFFSSLAEIWADEFWHPTALHYRFSFPEENFPAWRDEIGTLLKGFPRFMRHRMVKHFYTFMHRATDQTGTTPEKVGLIEHWTEAQLDMLENHFSKHSYLLGEHSTLADFALMGPIDGHLVWDKRSYKTLIEPRKHLDAWTKRMYSAGNPQGQLVPNDTIPDSLELMVHSIVSELLPYLEQCVAQLPDLPKASGNNAREEGMSSVFSRSRDERLIRMGPMVDVPYGEGTLHRATLPYTLWMLQRTLDLYDNMTEADASAIRQWLEKIGAERLLKLRFDRVRRIGLHIAPELATKVYH